MKSTFRAVRKSDQKVVVSQGSMANRFLSRLVGWIGRRQVAAGEGLLIERCNNIHMWMMSIPIDVAFLSNDYVIVKTVPGLKPWKFLPVHCREAKHTLELPVGTVEQFNLRPGEVLCIDS